MKTKLRLRLLFFALLILPGFAHGQGTAFTYQGRLTENAAPANGVVELQCTLWNALSGGTQMASGTPATTSVSITNGLFTVPLDFGTTAFDGSDRYLQIEARTTLGPFSLLTPRQKITATPYALLAGKLSGTVASSGLGGTYGNVVTFSHAANVFNGTFTGNASGLSNLNAASLGGLSASSFWKLGGNAATPPGANFMGTADNQALEFKVNGLRALRLEPTTTNGAVNVIAGSPHNSVAAGVAGATIGGGGGSYLGTLFSNRIAAAYGTVSGGAGNVSSGEFATVGGGAVNTSTGHRATVGGGAGNTSDGPYCTVGGGQENVAAGEHATVGGGIANTANNPGGFVGGGATVSGGGNNTARTLNATVGGGARNTASGTSSTVGGGRENTARDSSATVGGGDRNTASGSYATVGGGDRNTATNDHATVGGGQENTATGFGTVGGGGVNSTDGQYATVPGGLFNSASGRYSFAAGIFAKANHEGSFVWASRLSAAPSFAAARFHINAYNGLSVDYDLPRADGGGTKWIVIGATSGGDAISAWNGARLSNGGAWIDASDRNRKDSFAAVSSREILDKVAALPIQTWHYTNETAEIRHLGPVAQDFRAAFGLGSDDKSIATVDAGGVALAAIQGLNQKVEEKEKRIRELEKTVSELKEVVSKLAASRERQ
jgi:hypothetical protein